MKSNIPTLEEYNKALSITRAYEAEQSRLYNIKVKAFKKDLTEYFSKHTLDGYKIIKFSLEDGYIIPEDPYIDECYGGGNDEDIAKICKKHGVDFSIIYWCYPK